MRRKLITVASLVTIAAGSLLLTAPRTASASCSRDSLRAMCAWYGGGCGSSVTCAVDMTHCAIVDSWCS